MGRLSAGCAILLVTVLGNSLILGDHVLDSLYLYGPTSGVDMDISPEEQDKLMRLGERFGKSEFGLLEPQSKQELSRKKNAEIGEANKRILKEIEELLGPRRAKRYLQLATQRFLRKGDFLSVSQLWKHRVDDKRLDEMQRLFARRAEQRSQRLRDERWESMSLPLADLVGTRKLKQYAGEIFEPELPTGEGGFWGNIRDGFVDDVPLKLIVSLDVRKELSCTLNQVRRLDDLHRKHSKTLAKIRSLVLQETPIPGSDPIAMQEEAKKLGREMNQDLNASVLKQVLREDQAARFRQILFQQYVRDANYERAASLVGEKADSIPQKGINSHEDISRIRYSYIEQADLLKSGITAYETVMGPLTDEIGILQLSPETAFGTSDEETERIREQLSQKLRTAMSEKTPNPRLRDRAR